MQRGEIVAHHKRGRRKNARAGCLLCKSHKANGVKGCRSAQPMQERRSQDDERDQRGEENLLHASRVDALECVLAEA